MSSNQPDDAPVTPQVVDADDAAANEEENGPFATEPSKLIRIASMTRATSEEVRESSLDDQGRRRLIVIYHNSIDELRDVLSDDLKEELDAIFLPLEREIPTESELRIAQAQLVGWLEGLFHGIQASLLTQQMSAQAQLEQMRRRRALETPLSSDDDDSSGLYL